MKHEDQHIDEVEKIYKEIFINDKEVPPSHVWDNIASTLKQNQSPSIESNTTQWLAVNLKTVFIGLVVISGISYFILNNDKSVEQKTPSNSVENIIEVDKQKNQEQPLKQNETLIIEEPEIKDFKKEAIKNAPVKKLPKKTTNINSTNKKIDKEEVALPIIEKYIQNNVKDSIIINEDEKDEQEEQEEVSESKKEPKSIKKKKSFFDKQMETKELIKQKDSLFVPESRLN